jgi:hypothetical protein
MAAPSFVYLFTFVWYFHIITLISNTTRYFSVLFRNEFSGILIVIGDLGTGDAIICASNVFRDDGNKPKRPHVF